MSVYLFYRPLRGAGSSVDLLCVCVCVCVCVRTVTFEQRPVRRSRLLVEVQG